MKLSSLASSAVVLLVMSGCAQQQQLSETASTEGDTGKVSRFKAAFSKPLFSPRSAHKNPVRPKVAATSDQQQVDDIWPSIESALAFANEVPDRRIQRQLKWLDGNQKYFDRTLGRAQLYLPYVLEQVLDAGLPSEVALLPFIESAYNPFAYSHSGAAGLWQFIPSTGEHFGLYNTGWYEGRKDIVESTEAAISYLQSLNDMFDGDWLLTFAAYNGGPGTVKRAMEANARKGLKTDYWSLELSDETRRYVPRLVALSKVITQPEAYGIERLSISPDPGFSIVDLDRPVNLAQAARIAGIKADELYHLNPGYTKWVTPPDGPHRILLPGEVSDEFAERLASLPAKQWQPVKEYVVLRGDTLSGIARANNLSSQELASINHLDHQAVLRIGQILTVPGQPSQMSGYSSAVLTSYQVKPGDNLWAIAKANEVSVADLLKWNKLTKNSVLKVGQTLAFYKPKENSATQASNYRVRSGDSLYMIARKFNVKVSDLLAWNALGGNSLIRPGQELKVFSNN